MKVSQDADSEVYSARRFIKALSFKIGLLASLVVLVILVVTVAVVAGVVTGTCGRHSRTSIVRRTSL